MAASSLPWYEYFLVAVVLATSAAIGLTFRFTGGRQKTTNEYVNADRSLSILPVTLSMFMSFMSGITILGHTAETHTHGLQEILKLISSIWGHLISAIIILPMLYHLKLTSLFQYYDGRFSHSIVRKTSSVISIIGAILYMGSALYTPASVIATISPIPIWGSLLLMGGLATVYTSLGGLKAVVWSDAFQGLVTIGGTLAIAIVGLNLSGNISDVWDALKRGHRAWVTFDPSPIIRISFWSCLVAETASTMVVSPVGAQRLCSMKSLWRAQLSVLLLIPLKIGFQVITFTVGGAVFAYYSQTGCDPLLSEQMGSPNELLPDFVVNILQVPVLPGTLISILLVGALSSVTSSMNTNAMLTWKDFMEHIDFFKNMSENNKTLTIKLLSFTYGCIGIAMSFAYRYFPGHALQVTNAISGSATSPLVGMFLLGVLFPWANHYGTFIGGIVAFCFHFTIGLGASIINPYPVTLNATVSECPENTTINEELLLEKDVTLFFKFSHHWFTWMGVASCVVVGLIVSFATGPYKPEDVNPDYIIPLFDKMFCCLPESWRKVLWCGVDHDKETTNKQSRMDDNSTGSDQEEIYMKDHHLSDKKRQSHAIGPNVNLTKQEMDDAKIDKHGTNGFVSLKSAEPEQIGFDNTAYAEDEATRL